MVSNRDKRKKEIIWPLNNHGALFVTCISQLLESQKIHCPTTVNCKVILSDKHTLQSPDKKKCKFSSLKSTFHLINALHSHTKSNLTYSK